MFKLYTELHNFHSKSPAKTYTLILQTFCKITIMLQIFILKRERLNLKGSSVLLNGIFVKYTVFHKYFCNNTYFCKFTNVL